MVGQLGLTPVASCPGRDPDFEVSAGAGERPSPGANVPESCVPVDWVTGSGPVGAVVLEVLERIVREL
jgi:hypothetical protein